MSYKVFLSHPDTVLPTSATDGSAGYDLSSCVEDVVPAHQWKAIETGIIVQFPSDCYLRVAPRSGLAFKRGLDVFAGVVDSDYTGTIKVILMNNGNEDFVVKKGDRIAQMIYERIYKPTLEVVSSMAELEETARGAGGFGSTGVSNTIQKKVDEPINEDDEIMILIDQAMQFDPNAAAPVYDVAKIIYALYKNEYKYDTEKHMWAEFNKTTQQWEYYTSTLSKLRCLIYQHICQKFMNRSVYWNKQSILHPDNGDLYQAKSKACLEIVMKLKNNIKYVNDIINVYSSISSS